MYILNYTAFNLMTWVHEDLFFNFILPFLDSLWYINILLVLVKQLLFVGSFHRICSLLNEKYNTDQVQT